jgi:hypothetical protein
MGGTLDVLHNDPTRLRGATFVLRLPRVDVVDDGPWAPSAAAGRTAA